jgi:hypothetical protein
MNTGEPIISVTFPIPDPPPPRPVVYRETADAARLRSLEAEVRELTAIVEELQRQQEQVRRPRRRWYRRMTVLETWGDNQT